MEHLFDAEVARKYGVDAAIIIRHFQFWIIKNKADGRHQYEGRTWTYGSVKSFAEIFRYWTEAQVRQILKKLLAGKVLRKGHYSKKGYDRTTWYAFENEKAFLQAKKSICEFSQMDLRKPANGFVKNNRPITDKSTDKRIDKREGNPPTPEIYAQSKYRQAKNESGELPPEFFEWFEGEILGRWDKYGTTPAVLRDWHGRLWAKYKPDFVTEAVQAHRSESANWSPKFAEVVKIADRLRQKELAALKREQDRKSRQETIARIESEKKQPRVSLEQTHRRMSAAELLHTYETKPFDRRWIDEHYPELIEKARSEVVNKTSREPAMASAANRGS